MSDILTANDVVLDLKNGFIEEKVSLENRILEIETEINEINKFIESLNKKDDCDFNIFSPRSASRIYKDQVHEKKIRVDELEDMLKSLKDRLSFVTDKLNSIDCISPDNVSFNKSDTKIDLKEDKKAFLELQENDRQRIAADLHDSVLQNLSLLIHNMELSSKYIDVDPVRAKLEIEANRQTVKSIIEDIRSTIFDLRPMQFDDFGFKGSLETHLDSYKSRTLINISYDIDNIDDLDHIILLTIFRVVQELVNNAIKHSCADNLYVSIKDRSHRVIIEVKDDGIGVDPNFLNKEKHFGLKILKERVNMVNGLIVYPTVEKGFSTVIEIPY